MGEVAVLSKDIAAELMARGFKVCEVKQGKWHTIYYFDDGAELLAALKELTKERNCKNFPKTT